MTAADYDDFAQFYHLVYQDWNASLARQGRALDAIIRPAGILSDAKSLRVLDAACGIGTQSLGLAAFGYVVTASDLSAASVTRAEREAKSRGYDIAFSVADMRNAFTHHQQTFDVVIACDNSIPHLLTDADIRLALEEFYRCTSPGGQCLISVRDYGGMELSGTQVHSLGVRQEGNTRFVLSQLWEFETSNEQPPADGPRYALSFYVIEDAGQNAPRTHVMRSRYYAITLERLAALMTEAGFAGVERLDGPFFQPVLRGFRDRD